MPKFSKASEAQLRTCHPNLQIVLREAILITDFTVLEGHRGREAQEKAFREGNSKVQWPKGKHNQRPSLAVDVAPYPVSWAETTVNLERFAYLAGVIMSVAHRRGIKLRWGNDWDSDGDTFETKFRDRPHFELIT